MPRSLFGELRVLFDCPICRVHHDGPIEVGLENNPDAPLFEDPSPFLRYPVLIDQTFTTTACDDTFSIGMYEVHWITYGEPPEVSRLIVCEKGLGSDNYPDPRALPGVW